MDFIDLLRATAGIPLTINSGYRCEKHNKRVGGKVKSAHRLGVACDIKCVRSDHRFKIIEAAMQLGFKRIGVYPTFIHLDREFSSLPQEVMWLST
jgi:zinc D-Ala-D-Ala carboxypeptidase